jgi:lipopolysaccharide export system ATP-binding protein
MQQTAAQQAAGPSPHVAPGQRPAAAKPALLVDAPRRASAEPARPMRRSTLPPLPALDRKFPGLVALNLQKSFGKRKVLHDVNIGIRPGEVVGLLGPNGAGKTTSFYIVCGLIQADQGYVGINARNVSAMPMYRRAKYGLGYLPQEASIFRGLTVEQNIMAALEVVQPDRSKRKQRLEELLAEFSITHLRSVNALALSGGERRRTEIARSLASNPQYVLLDEPFAGVDPIAVGDIRNLVGQLKQRGIGVLITDHNVRDTLNVVDRAYIIYDGRVLMQGEPAEIVRDERVRKVYLGSDFEL